MRAMITVYGISNCDTVKKARAWLAGNQLAYEFHDFKKSGVPAHKLAAWEKAVGWEKLLNRQGTTWRKLAAQVQAATVDAASAQAVMLAHPSTIKRPVVEWGAQITVGFDAASWATRGAGSAAGVL
jgi:arsenate reductase (glutaredoxin)